jgi:uncharacterized membrane protein YjfL (UPF0719 family)
VAVQVVAGAAANKLFQQDVLMEALNPDALIATLVYTSIGMVAFGIAFFLMTRFAPFSVRKELEEDQNVALAIVMGSVIIGIAMIIAATVGD